MNKQIKQLKSIIFSLDRNLRDIILFCIITLGFHFFYRYWSGELNYSPIAESMNTIFDFLSEILFRNSIWVLHHFTNYEFSTNARDIFIGPGYVGVHYGCSGLKQFLQWIVLMSLFTGPIKQKLWFIPAGIVVLHGVNVFRIVSLSVLLLFIPEHWDFFHTWVFRPFFYVVIFGMWIIWNDYIKKIQ